MKVYLIRHAEAVSEEVAGADRDRWLSARGRDEARGLARLLRGHHIAFDAIVASPLPRAQQTAELLAAGLGFDGTVDVEPALAPGVHPRHVLDGLAARGDAVAVIGHEPTISALAALLSNQASVAGFRTAQCSGFDDGVATFTARADLMQLVGEAR